MALIKCKNCGKEISDKATKCVHCGENFINNDNNNTNIKKDDIKNNIIFFLYFAIIIRIFFFIAAFIILLFGLLANHEIVFIASLAGCVGCVILGIIVSPFIKWMAYVLKNLYELNKKE